MPSPNSQNSNSADSDLQARRLTALETSLMHLQNDYESLNEAVLENAHRLDRLAKLLQRLTDRFEAASDSDPERDPLDEKPPHY